MFIIIEGGDASGKTTLVENIKSFIKESDKPFKKDDIIFLKSPTPPFSDFWKTIISHKNITPLTRFKLFHAIAYNDSEVCKAAIKNGKNVILERYFQSTEAFNYTLDNFYNIDDPDLRSENHVSYLGLLKPDLGFLLDVSDDKRIERMSDRFKNVFESPWENPEFQTPLNIKLREIANREKFITIDTTIMTKPEVTKFVIDKIMDLTNCQK